MKKYILIITFLLLFPIMVYSLDGYVVDEAGLLSDNTIDFMNQYSNYLDSEADASLYTVIVNQVGEYDIDAYSDLIFDEYNIGSNDILILFANDKKSLKILVGEDISYYFSSDYLDEVIDLYFAPFIKNHDYDKGLKNGFSALYIDLSHYYGIDSSDIELSDGNDFLTKYKTIILIISLSISLLISYFFCIFFRNFLHTKKHSFTDYFMFGIISFFNIVLVCLAYSLEPASVVVYLAVVLYVVMRIFGEDNNVSISEALFKARETEREKARERKRKKRK